MTHSAGRPAPRSHLMPLGIAALAIMLLAGNMRTAVNAVAVVMPQMRDTLGMSGGVVGLLAALPTFCFAVIGSTGPALARRIGLSRTALASAVALTAGQLIRAAFPGVGWVFIGSVIAMAAVAMINVIMPSLVRAYFPRHIAAMTTAYTAVMAIVASSVAFGTIPLIRAFGGGYQLGLGMWAVLSAVTILPWLAALRTSAEPVRPGEKRLRLADIARTPNAWAVAVLFGMQSLQAYVVFGLYPVILTDGGMAAQPAAAQVGVVALALAAAGLVIPVLVNRLRHPAAVPYALTVFYLAGYAGLLVQPQQLTVLWSILIGIGGGFFPFALFVVNIRARTHTGVLTLSAFMQSVGYLIAGTGVTAIGVIQGESRDWTWVIVALICLCVIQQYTALISVRRWYIEDVLPAAARPAEPPPAVLRPEDLAADEPPTRGPAAPPTAPPLP